MKTPGLYIIHILITDAFYVGISADTKQRFRQHRNCLKKNTHANPMLQNAWNKYGENSFVFRHLKTIEDINIRYIAEINLITKLRNAGRKVYNIGEGGEGQPHTPETRAKISAAHKGKKISEQTKKNMSKAQKGHPAHPNTIAAISAYWKGKKRKPMSEETKRKISLAKKGTPSHPWTEESKQKLRKSLIGKKHSDITRQNMSNAHQKALARGQRSHVRTLTYNGITLCMLEWAIKTGIKYQTIQHRLKSGWSIEETLTTPVIK